jgi:HEAT repeat protein
MASLPSEAAECEIRSSIAALNCLHNGEAAVLKLLSHGPSAIEPLKEFLLHGKPSNVYQPRRWAVEALARLGARDILIEYLRWKKDIPDPVLSTGEQAVEDAAARELAALPGKDVLQLFLDLARTRPLPAVLEALGEFQAIDAIPYLIDALEDDVLRHAAKGALQKMAIAARPALLEASVKVFPEPNHESPSSLLRRIMALDILADMGIPAGRWPALRPLLDDADPRIIVAASRIAVGMAEARGDGAKIVKRLFDLLGSADWSLQPDIEQLLVCLFDEAKPLLENEIERRGRVLEGEHGWDPVLLSLLRVRRQAEGVKAHGS